MEAPTGIKKVKNRPSGCRKLGGFVRETEKAVLFDYHDWELWLPKTAVVLEDGKYWAMAWAIESAKEFQTTPKPKTPFPEEPTGDGKTEALQWILKVAEWEYENNDQIGHKAARTLKRIADRAEKALGQGGSTNE